MVTVQYQNGPTVALCDVRNYYRCDVMGTPPCPSFAEGGLESIGQLPLLGVCWPPSLAAAVDLATSHPFHNRKILQVSAPGALLYQLLIRKLQIITLIDPNRISDSNIMSSSIPTSTSINETAVIKAPLSHVWHHVKLQDFSSFWSALSKSEFVKGASPETDIVKWTFKDGHVLEVKQEEHSVGIASAIQQDGASD